MLMTNSQIAPTKSPTLERDLRDCDTPCAKNIDVLFNIDVSASMRTYMMDYLRTFVLKLLALLDVEGPVEIAYSFFFIHSSIAFPFDNRTTQSQAARELLHLFSCDVANRLPIDKPPFSYPCGPSGTIQSNSFSSSFSHS
jgi:hypothetical protein